MSHLSLENLFCSYGFNLCGTIRCWLLRSIVAFKCDSNTYHKNEFVVIAFWECITRWVYNISLYRKCTYCNLHCSKIGMFRICNVYHLWAVPLKVGRFLQSLLSSSIQQTHNEYQSRDNCVFWESITRQIGNSNLFFKLLLQMDVVICDAL